MFRLQAWQISVASTYAWDAVSLLPFIFCNDLHLACFDLLVHCTVFTITLQRQRWFQQSESQSKKQSNFMFQAVFLHRITLVLLSQNTWTASGLLLSLWSIFLYDQVYIHNRKIPSDYEMQYFYIILRNCTASLSISKNYFPLKPLLLIAYVKYSSYPVLLSTYFCSCHCLANVTSFLQHDYIYWKTSFQLHHCCNEFQVLFTNALFQIWTVKLPLISATHLKANTNMQGNSEASVNC